jgi:hypothetical protein
VDGVDPAFQRALQRFGAKVRAVQRFHPANPGGGAVPRIVAFSIGRDQAT